MELEKKLTHRQVTKKILESLKKLTKSKSKTPTKKTLTPTKSKKTPTKTLTPTKKTRTKSKKTPTKTCKQSGGFYETFQQFLNEEFASEVDDQVGGEATELEALAEEIREEIARFDDQRGGSHSVQAFDSGAEYSVVGTQEVEGHQSGGMFTVAPHQPVVQKPSNTGRVSGRVSPASSGDGRKKKSPKPKGGKRRSGRSGRKNALQPSSLPLSLAKLIEGNYWSPKKSTKSLKKSPKPKSPKSPKSLKRKSKNRPKIVQKGGSCDSGMCGAIP